MDTDALRILLVEDDEDDYLIIRRTLEHIIHQSYELTWEKTYENGVNALKRYEYDACLLDYRLGKHTGLEFLKEIGTSDNGVPVIILTGFEAYDVDIESMKKGAADFLAKDQITPSLLERSIRYSIERRHFKDALLDARDTLEETVKLRTMDLELTNHHLKKEISERKRAEKASIHAKMEWELTFDAISDLIAVIDQNQLIVRCNKAFAAATGTEYHDIIGQPCGKWFPFVSEHFGTYPCKDSPLYEKENFTEYHSDLFGGDFILNLSPLKNPDGEIIGSVLVARNITERKKYEAEREELISKLRDALGEVKTLSGLLPICSSCKKIRDDEGYWNQMEAYISNHSEADFTHSICPACAKKLYSDIDI